VGWFDGQGRGAFAVALRSALLRGSSARLFVGAGLVRGSTPEGELRETALKARSLLDALGVRP
jgi:isochorismate synthase EntC